MTRRSLKQIIIANDYLRPWKLVTLALGLGLLIAGSIYYQFEDWDVGISLIMGTLTYLFTPVLSPNYVG